MEHKRTFKVLNEEIKYKNPWITVCELTTEKDGKNGIYGVVHRSDSSTLLIKTLDEKILFVRQYRFPTDTYSWELPMGGIDKPETPFEAANRELREETGLDASLAEIGKFYPVPGLTPQKVYVFQGIIDNSMRKRLTAKENLVDEIVERKFFSCDEIKKMIKNGQISDGFTLCSLSLLAWR